MRMLIMVINVEALGACNVKWIAASISVGFISFLVYLSALHPAFTLGSTAFSAADFRGITG